MPAKLTTPPHSLDAEESVLGGLMIAMDAWDRVAGKISEQDFYDKRHQQIFAAITELAGRAETADPVTVAECLRKNGNLETVGGLAAIGELVRNTPSAANIDAYAKIVHDYAVFRSLQQAAHHILAVTNTPKAGELSATLHEIEQLIYEIATRGHAITDATVSASSIMQETLNRIDELACLQGNITGIPSGYIDLDEITTGFQNGDFVVVAGRPSMGKTTFAMNLAENAALRYKIPTLVFSLEMPSQQLLMRMLASVGQIELQRIRTGNLDDDGCWSRLVTAAGKVSEAPVFLNDTPAMTPIELTSIARRAKREHNIGLIVVDYVQLMRVPEVRNNRQEEVSQISRAMKAMAKELDIPVIALSQLNRSLEQRPNKRPVMSDLRDSGALEQDADLVAFVYRDEVYNEDSPDAGSAEIIIGKQRNGPIGTIRLSFLREFARFESYFAHLPPETGDQSAPTLPGAGGHGPRESTDEPPTPALPPVSAYDDVMP